jgi:GNAT superfamily N-acetyltransferase
MSGRCVQAVPSRKAPLEPAELSGEDSNQKTWRAPRPFCFRLDRRLKYDVRARGAKRLFECWWGFELLKPELVPLVTSNPDVESVPYLMGVELEPVAFGEPFINAALAERARHAPSSPISRLFRVRADGEEAGLVVLDVWCRSDEVVLYELYIDPKHRHRGIGSGTLKAVEGYARSLGRRTVKLIPHSLDPTVKDTVLIEWYRSLGYSWERGLESCLVKAV